MPGSTPLASPRAALRDSWEGSSCSLEGAELPFTGPLAWAGALQGWARPWPAEQKPGAFQRTGQSVPTRSLAPRAADALKACGMERAPA